MTLLELLAGPFDGLVIHGPDCDAIRFRGRMFVHTDEFTVEGLPIFWDCGREFHALLDGISDVGPGLL